MNRGLGKVSVQMVAAALLWGVTAAAAHGGGVPSDAAAAPLTAPPCAAAVLGACLTAPDAALASALPPSPCPDRSRTAANGAPWSFCARWLQCGLLAAADGHPTECMPNENQ